MVTIHCGTETTFLDFEPVFLRVAQAMEQTGLRVDVTKQTCHDAGDEELVWLDGDTDDDMRVIAAVDALAVQELEAMATFDNDDPADW